LASVETLSKVGPPAYADGAVIAKAFIREAPGRLIWGSNWPHSTSKNKPDDVLLFDLFAQWAPDESIRSKILVHNPEQLFGF
jgi:predicted TIM-barrel fold metal-dependent hydrolase